MVLDDCNASCHSLTVNSKRKRRRRKATGWSTQDAAQRRRRKVLQNLILFTDNYQVLESILFVLYFVSYMLIQALSMERSKSDEAKVNNIKRKRRIKTPAFKLNAKVMGGSMTRAAFREAKVSPLNCK